MIMKEELEIGGYRITWLRKSIKRMHLRIKPPLGEITVSSPMRLSRREVSDFVTAHLAWIHEKRPGCIVCSDPALLSDGDSVPIFGRTLPLSVSLARRVSASLSDSEIRLCVRTDDPMHRRAALTELYRQQIAARADALFAYWRQKTGLAPEEIAYRSMKTRWGSCQTVKKKITLNLRLALYDPVCLDYVILHELVHLCHPNHGKGFYAMLSQYMPDWKAHKSLLTASARAMRGKEPI